MANYKQTKTPNLDPYVYQSGVVLFDWLGYCLAYAQAAYGTPHVADSAWDAWTSYVKWGHSNRNFPTGVWVPIWFDGWWAGFRYGHVALLFKDASGKITISSSPISHKPYADTWSSIEAVEANYGMKFVGWSEDMCGTRVIEAVADSIAATARKVGTVEVAYRKAAARSGEFIQWWDPGAVVNFKGYVRGESIDNNNIWFVGAFTGFYSWSGGFTDEGTHDLPDLTPKAPVVTPPVVTPPVVVEPPYTFTKDLDIVTEVLPAANGNFARGSFPTHPSGIVLHDFGTANVNTFKSVKNTFTKAGSEVSAHFVFSQGNIVQMVALKDRAYHARAIGNELWGFEIDPAFKDDPVQIANVKKVIAALQKREGKKLNLHKHPEFVATSCGDDIDLAKYQVAYPETTPEVPVVVPPVIVEPPVIVTPPVVVEPPVKPTTPDETPKRGIIELLVEIVRAFLAGVLSKLKK